jgi:hypothetical protein
MQTSNEAVTPWSVPLPACGSLRTYHMFMIVYDVIQGLAIKARNQHLPNVLQVETF